MSDIDIDMDIDNKVHLFAIRENALDVYPYPFLSTFNDLKKFLSSEVECDGLVQMFFRYPNDYCVFDCGTYEPLLLDSSNNPFNPYSRPRLVGRVIDFRGGDNDGKSECTDKNI